MSTKKNVDVDRCKDSEWVDRYINRMIKQRERD